MKTFVILQKSTFFRSDWRKLVNRENYRLVLITEVAVHKELAPDQLPCFDEIYALEKFEAEHVSNTMQSILSSALDKNFYIITHDEFCIELATKLRTQFGLPGDNANIVKPFTNKIYSKSLLAKHNIALPKHMHFHPEEFKKNATAYLNHTLELMLPIFAKPIDGADSQNASKLSDKNALENWCTTHLNDQKYELDEYIEGTMFHCDSIVHNNQILFAEVAQDAYPCFEFTQGKITGSRVLTSDDTNRENILKFNARVLAAFQNIPNGVTHMEVFLKNTGELCFLEIACRSPGGMAVQMYEKYWGINFEQAHFMMQMGLPFTPTDHIKRGPYVAWAWFPIAKGTVRALYLPPLQSEHQVTWKAQIGQEYTASPQCASDYAGSVLLWNANAAKLLEDFTLLTNTQGFVITE